MLPCQRRKAVAHSCGDNISAFRNLMKGLPAEYQQKFRDCTTGDRVLESLKDYGASWSSRSCRLGAFARAMKPFFIAMDLFVPCDPMRAATFWGALGVVIVLGMNFNGFLDKATSGLGEVAKEVESFAEINTLVQKLERRRFKETEEVIDRELTTKLKDGWTAEELEERLLELKGQLNEATRMTIRMDLDQLVHSSPRIQSILQDTFMEIVHFLMAIFRILYHPDEKSRKAMQVLADTVQEPFRFDHTMARIRDLRERFDMEIGLLNLKISKNAKDISEASEMEAEMARTRASKQDNEFDKATSNGEGKVEKKARYAFIQRALQWLDSPSFTGRYDDMASHCMQGTAGWLFEEPSFVSWSRDQSRFGGRSLWVCGNPGSGKSVLAATTIDKMRRSKPSNPICYFFFDSTQDTIPNNSSTAYRALLSQLLKYKAQDRQVKEALEFAMYFQSPGRRTASQQEVDELMELCVHSDDNVYLVLDGLDECSDLQVLVEKIRRIAGLQTTRLALFSRPTSTSLSKKIPNLETISIGSSNNEDIQVYLHRALKDMKHERLLASTTDSKTLAKILTERADGVFLWARLMIRYLRSPVFDPAERTQTITKMDSSEGLDVMYERILHLIERGDKTMNKIAGQTFTWLLYGKRPMTPAELGSSLVSSGVSPEEEEAWKRPDFEAVVVRACGGLVERSPRSIEFLGNTFHPLRFIHASAKEYFIRHTIRYHSDPASGSRLIPPPPVVAHAQLATICLKYLTYRVPAQPLSGVLGENATSTSVRSAFPFSNYAMLQWSSHLVLTIHGGSGNRAKGELGQLFSALEQFFAQPKVLMAWIEGCYVYGEHPKAGSLRRWGQDKALSIPQSQGIDIRKTIVEFSEYLARLEVWGDTLLKAPASIWEETTAFTPSPLLLKHTGISVKPLKPSRPKRSGLSKEPINCLTQVTPDGLHHVILSVFASEKFEHHNKQTQADKLCEDKSFSRGWILRYEVTQLSDQRSVASLEIPLEEFDVWARLCETLLRGSVQIPMSMGQDCRFFTVMTILYHVTLKGDKILFASHTLPVAPSPGLKTNVTQKPTPKGLLAKVGCGSQSHENQLSYQDFTRYDSNDLNHVLLYWIHIDYHGKKLCYATQERASPARLRVFNIDVSTTDGLILRTKEIAERRFWSRDIGKPYEDRDNKEFEMCFHPYLPIIVYVWAKGTYVWNFKTDAVAKAGHGADEVAFLSCTETGDSCILTPKGQRPEIIPIQSAMVETGISNTKLHKGYADNLHAARLVKTQNATAKAPSGEHGMTTPTQILAQALLGQGKPLTGSSVLARPDGSVDHVSVLNSGLTVNIHLWDNDGGDESMVLTRLPNTEGVESARVSVIRPMSENVPVQIVLDKPADTWSRITPTAPMAFPMLVERDIRSFATRTTTTAATSLSVDGGRSRPPNAIRDVGEESNDGRKRGRLRRVWHKYGC